MKANDVAVVYRCPACSEAVFGAAEAFSQRSGRVRLKCACGGSVLESEKDEESGKLEMRVPCVFCERPHEYRIDPAVLLSGRFFQLGCPQTALPALFVGPASVVSDAVEENENEIKRIASEAGIDLENGGARTVDRSAVTERILRLLGDLKAEGRILCECEDGKSGDLSLTVGTEGVTVACGKCGAKRFFRALSTLDCEYLSDIDLLYLE